MKKIVIFILTSYLSVTVFGCQHLKNSVMGRWNKSSNAPVSFSASSTMIPLNDFFRNPIAKDFEISPDGKMLAFLKPSSANRLNVFTVEIAKLDPELTQATQLTDVKDRDISEISWKWNRTILYSKDEGGDENFHLYSVQLDTKKIRDLTPFPSVRADVANGLELINPKEVIIALNKRNKEVFDLYRVNVFTGELTLVAQNPGTFSGWLIDHQGQVRGAVSNNGVMTELYYRKSEKEKFKKTFWSNFKTTVNPLFFSFEKGSHFVYAISNLNRDKSAVVKFDLLNGKEVETLFENPEVDIDGLGYSKKRKVLLSALYVTEKTHRKFFDSQIQDIFVRLNNKLPGYELSLTGVDLNETVYIVYAHNDRTRGTYYLYEIQKDQLTKLMDLSPWINESAMSEMKPISYQSRDGLTIHGYLTLPLNYKVGDKVPFVINPHGGPWVRDTWGFDPVVQWLANRGYGVLQMNFRGSTGYGRKFWEASFKQWGRAMQDDVTDGVRWIIESNYALPQKICIYGGSYGGYSVLAGLTFTPDIYACGVDYVGISNLFTWLKTIPPYWKPFLPMTYEQLGHPEKDKELLEEISPIFHVDKIKAPLFVAQGANDPRVNVNESNQIVQALRDRGVGVEYLLKDNEGHGFDNEENRLEFFQRMEKFLAQHLGAVVGH